ncbi:hypothetical protein E9531_16945 [Lampropedia puyangensis]|uniref:Uncharacterized protein n=1 Tax=Lampropedia puyangensis TaxID=1330072 RepID=A0A4S8EP47_9BURK|nr:hypothetical protein [Lampropedia puyangensis]THT95968.1 hypothetical protein E9531_16945 [Lampropedia puyangensis]
MRLTSKNIRSNPLALVRSLPTKLVSVNQIKLADDRVTDEIFVSRYKAFLLGKSVVHQTRVSLDLIRSGFWKKDQQGNWGLINNPIDPKHLQDAIAMIRLGSRPALHLYENPNQSDSKRFVCSDDEVTYAAYGKLEISKVPVVLMAKPRDLEESCLSVRCYQRKGKDSIALLEGIVPVIHELVPSILGQKKPELIETLDTLTETLRDLKEPLRAFHQPGSVTLHYHHTLYSVLFRAEECLDSMKLLISKGRVLLAAALLRSLHELALVFYVDWLTPMQTYRYLQMASVIPEREWEATCERWRKEEIAAGTSPLDAKNIKDAHMRAFRLGSVVNERARIFPLGEDFHRDVYRFLSEVVHHDFSMTARYTHTLDNGDDAVYFNDVLKAITHLSDIIVAAIVTRVRSDLGPISATPSSSVD